AQGAGDQLLPVADQRIRFAAEDRHAVLRRQPQERLDAATVRFAGSNSIVVGRSSRRPDGPVPRPAAELVTCVPVADPGLFDKSLQSLAVELRIVAAVRAAAAVNQHLDAVSLKKLEEYVRRQVAVADRVEDH